MTDIIDKPDHSFMKVLIIGGLFAGIFGIIGDIDIIIKWFKEIIW